MNGSSAPRRRVGFSNRRFGLGTDRPSPRWLYTAGPALVVLVALFLRLDFFRDSLYGDEVGAFYDVAGHGIGRVIHLLSGHSPELNPPLYFLIAWLSDQLFGTSAEALRAISLLSGLIVIPLTYLLARITVGIRAGLVAAGLVALSPFLIWYSSEARPYSLMLMLTLASTVALLQAVKTRSIAWWAAYAAASCAAMYTHFTSVFLLVVQFAWCFAHHRDARRPLILANLAAAIGFLPWLPNLIHTAHSPGTRLYGLLEPLTVHAVRTGLAQIWIGTPQFSVSTLPGDVAVGVALAGLAVAIAGTLSASTASSALTGSSASRSTTIPRRPTSGIVLLALLAFAVPLGIAVYSALRPSVWNSRDLISSLPGFAALLAALLTFPRGRWTATAVALVLAALLFAAVKMRGGQYHRPDYRAVASFIDRHSRDHEPVVNWPDLSPGPPNELEAALALSGSPAQHPVLRLGAAPLSEVLRAPPYAAVLPLTGETIAKQAARLAGSGRLFLVLPTPVSIATLQGLRARHISSTPTSNILALLAAFMGALPERFRFTSMHVYDGLHRATAYILTGS